MHRLHTLFNPDSIAVIGASNKAGHIGYSVMRNLVHGEFKGRIFPINPTLQNIFGNKAFPSVEEVGDKIDLAIVAVPASVVPSVLEQCAKKSIRHAVVLSSGFKEIGEKGSSIFRSVEEIAGKNGMTILGPNCLGFIRPKANLNASFANKMARPGSIAFVSQSGALCTAVLDWSVRQNIGFSYFISIGEALNVGFDDLINFLGSDPDTSSILLYMESLTNARKFMSAARAYARSKPIIVFKSGKSLEGAHAAKSHTGSMAGNDLVYDAAFKRAGMVRVSTVRELFDCAAVMSTAAKPHDNRVVILTNAGGPGVIATDYLVAKGGRLAELSADSMRELDALLPDAWSHGNPVDIMGDADGKRYAQTLAVALKDPNVDAVIVVLTPQAVTDPSAIAREVAAVAASVQKPVLAVWMGEDDVAEGKFILEHAHIPVYQTPEGAVRSVLFMHTYSKNIDLLYQTPATIPHAFKPATQANRDIIAKAASEKRFTLHELEAHALLQNYGIPVTETQLAKSEDEAVAIANKIGYPVVLKILSPDILHKIDIGAVKVNLSDADGVRLAYRSILDSCREKAHEACIEGVIVSPMEQKQYELFLGCKKDPIFGPVIAFGMGGIAVEVFNDINVGLPPLNMALARQLIDGTKISKLLRGYRGMQGVDASAIEFIFYKFAYLVMDFPEIAEIDINPLMVDQKGAVVVDAKVVLDKATIETPVKPYQHLVISPYPAEYIRDVELAGGMKVVLRPIRPEDEPMEAEMFTHFSEETQMFRFFTKIKDITHQMLIRYTQIDYDREIAIIAEHTDDGGKKRMLGVARLIADSYNDTAEFAIVVADPWQGHGLGNILTDYILEIARERDIKKVYAMLLPENRKMLGMFKKRNFTIKPEEGNFLAELVLKAGS